MAPWGLQPETATLQQTKATPSEATDRAWLLRETCDLERLSDKILFSFNFSKHQTTPMWNWNFEQIFISINKP